MLGYSRSRQDFIQKLAEKYAENTVYTVNENQMKEAIYIEGESCSRCFIMKPHVEKYCYENWIELQCVKFDDESVKEFQISSVPMLVIREGWEVEEILDEAGIVNLISNQK